MLVRAAFHLAGAAESHTEMLARGEGYIDSQGGVAGLRNRYGKDKTFAVPILTNSALAGLVPWREVSPLPFELACLPHAVLRFLGLPVVSYAVPALVAIGQARYFHRKPRNPITRLVRRLAVNRSLETLRRMQPDSGGFLEATPLTSFVVMSLAGTGRVDHPVVGRGVDFLVASARNDGSWPIDTNLATWVTTLAINALAASGEDVSGLGCTRWLLSCQHRRVHPFTNAAPGGWGWSDLSGAVPDADDTPGALLALAAIRESRSLGRRFVGRASEEGGRHGRGSKEGSGFRVQGSALRLGTDSGTDEDPEPRTLNPEPKEERDAGASHQDQSETPGDIEQIDDDAAAGIRWLLDLQNADGGWPTFCRGWGKLPFDRSGVDLTAHVVRALDAWKNVPSVWGKELPEGRARAAVRRGLGYLAEHQRPDGSWVPLWFGNQYHPAEENPTYGTARVLLAYRDLGLLDTEPARRGLTWLAAHCRAEGGWGGGRIASGRGGTQVRGVEETAMALEALISAGADRSLQPLLSEGLAWLVEAVSSGRHRESSPIGFYFARLWYYERLYPLIFSVSALGAAVRCWRSAPETNLETSHQARP